MRPPFGIGRSPDAPCETSALSDNPDKGGRTLNSQQIQLPALSHDLRAESIVPVMMAVMAAVMRTRADGSGYIGPRDISSHSAGDGANRPSDQSTRTGTHRSVNQTLLSADE
jgi:hypothetical protein